MKIKLLRELNIFLILFFLATLVVFLALNGSAFLRDIKYAILLNSPFTSGDLRGGDILDVPDVVTAGGENSETENTLALLIIPSIDVNAPIAIPKNETKGEILASLERGAGLYPGSAPLGAKGRMVLLGHSSKASWYRGEYAYVFTAINQLNPPDEFYIATDSKKYVYRVFARKVLTPADTNTLLAGQAVDSELDLITCYPIGGASKRTVVQSILIRVENI